MGTRLGKYTLERKIGAGGMADVWLARGPNGVCVLKCPHRHLCDNAEFVRMFLDEASLLAQLHHPGIAQIYDLGQVDGAYYLAMEYVPGYDLMSISLEHERHGELMAPELCARIVADAAAALHYAHEARGKNGQPLNIVHRDVTPHNILLSTKGVVKLIDFGVAKASSTMHRTQAGFVKGKYPYMSPEQITGQAIDRRVDVYALGLVLYELLTNVRAIPGNTEIEQIDAARAGRIRPIEQLRPNTPVPLRQIIGAATFSDVDGRYPTALALKEDLEKYLALERQVVGQDDLLRLFRVVSADLGAIAEPDAARPTELEQPVSGSGAVVVPNTTLPPNAVDLLGYSPTEPSMKSPVIPLKSPVASPPPSPALVVPEVNEPVQAPVSRTPLIVLTVLSLLIIGLVLVLWQPWAAPTAPIAAAVDAGSTAIPGKVESFTFPPTTTDAAVAELVDAGAEEPAVVVEVRDAGAAPVPDPLRHPPEVAPARLTVTAAVAATVLVDGREIGVTPVELEVSPGVHAIVVKGEGVEKKVSWKFKSGESRALVVPAATKGSTPPAPAAGAKGSLRIDASPFCVMRVDGKALSEAPVSFKELELPVGPHAVECVLADPSLPAPRVKKQKITVKDGETSSVQFNMLE
ncbi:MAG: serine/threonine protein kinase [Myxococcota bacterium]